MKKIIKILVLVLSIGVIAFSVIKIVNPDLLTFGDSGDGDLGGYVERAETLVGKTDGECELKISVRENDEVNVNVMNTNKYGILTRTNSFFPIDQLYDCRYDDDIIFWMIQYGADNDHFASIVPQDCIGAEIGGVMFKSKTAEIQIDNKTVSFKYVLTDLEHIDLADDNREVVLIDEKGKAHKEINSENPFD